MFGPGDPIPSVYLRTANKVDYALDSVGGRYIVISFIAGRNQPGAADYLAALYGSGELFDDERACCFVVSSSAEDCMNRAIEDRLPGIRVVWDFDHRVSRAFGNLESATADTVTLRLVTFVLDPALRVVEVIPVDDLRNHFEAVRAVVAALPDPRAHTDGWAPVLQVPGLLEPELCREFIAYAERTGLEDSGFMTTDPATGQTVGMINHRHKRRSDCMIEDADLRRALEMRVVRRLVPQMEKAFQFKATRLERYLIACYEGETGGWFRPHKDNTTLGTAHRRFAVTIALNDEYEGGGLRFPEFGRRVYRPAAGEAIVFSCSLLHEALPVTGGRRFCLLPFLYDEAAAEIRLANARHLADEEKARQVIASVKGETVAAGPESDGKAKRASAKTSPKRSRTKWAASDAAGTERPARRSRRAGAG